MSELVIRFSTAMTLFVYRSNMLQCFHNLYNLTLHRVITDLIMKLKVGVHFNGLPAAQSILIDALQKVRVLLYIPDTVPVNSLGFEWKLISTI